jgi:hypothetical protein
VTAIPLPAAALAQDIEPRRYSNAPVGVNFVIGVLARSSGALPFDPSVPITDAELQTTTGLFAYARVLDFGGRSGKVDLIVLYSDLSGTALYRGEPISRDVTGFGDPRLRLSINLVGAPALSAAEFADYRQDLIVGASLQASAPVGQYDRTRLVNIGSNRWSFKPEIGVSKATGPWTLAVAAAVTVFTDNDDFYNGGRREQDPLYSVRGHAIYALRSGIWVSADATYFAGGRTTIDGVLNNDLQQNWRVGATRALPVDRRNAVKRNASSGVSARTGNNFDLFGAAWQYRWGGGL